MEKTINDVHKYFVQKLLNGEFVVSETEEATAHILYVVVDGKYKFCIWMANAPMSAGCYYSQGNFMHLEFTDEEAEKLRKATLPHYEREYVDVVKAEKTKKYYELKEELEL